MNGIDYLIVAALAVSMLLGMFRGFVREAIGVLSWLGGLWLAWRYAYWIEPHLGGMIGEQPVSTWAARTLIVLAVLIAGWLTAALLTYLLRHSGLSLTVDRALGVLFGLVRGAVVVAVFVLFGQFVELNRVEWWRQSSLLPYATELAGWIHTFAETGMQALEREAAHGSSGPDPSGASSSAGVLK
ncbi:MAG TPA: CvpA family protein [Steroidobacter sp.]|jgi:membrane protein required for colicin V production|nr:CvpA family protein [Steroidobacteraceae bacterium]HLS81503.1 CvpA family protein [Steroidobacter sp.]